MIQMGIHPRKHVKDMDRYADLCKKLPPRDLRGNQIERYGLYQLCADGRNAVLGDAVAGKDKFFCLGCTVGIGDFRFDLNTLQKRGIEGA